MYDRATRTLWHQFTGVPIIGELVDSGIVLSYFPTSRTTWGDWRAEHPDTTVLSLDGARYPAWSYTHEKDERSIYWSYRASSETMFPISFRDAVLEPKAEVLGVSIKGIDKAYPIEALRQERIVHDRVADIDIVVIASPSSSDAHIYENPQALRFSLPTDATDTGFPSVVVDDDGTEWSVSKERLVSSTDADLTLSAIPSNVSFWFGWYAFHRETELYGR